MLVTERTAMRLRVVRNGLVAGVEAPGLTRIRSAFEASDGQKGTVADRLATTHGGDKAIEMVRKRGGWLTVLFAGQLLTAGTMSLFEGQLAPSWYVQIMTPSENDSSATRLAAETSGGSQERLKREILALLEEVSRMQPVVLCFDDMHWADPSSRDLLRYLLVNRGRVLSKAQILDHVWEYDFNGDASIVESYISYLRRKIDTTEPRLLHTVRGVGYVLRVPRTS